MTHTLQGLLGSIKEIKKEQSLLQAAESQSKVSEIYNAVQKWDSVATLLPDLVCEHFCLKLPIRAVTFYRLIGYMLWKIYISKVTLA